MAKGYFKKLKALFLINCDKYELEAIDRDLQWAIESELMSGTIRRGRRENGRGIMRDVLLTSMGYIAQWNPNATTGRLDLDEEPILGWEAEYIMELNEIQQRAFLDYVIEYHEIERSAWMQFRNCEKYISTIDDFLRIENDIEDYLIEDGNFRND